MNILIIGNGLYDIYEPAIESRFKKLGYEVDIFYWKGYFKDYKFSNTLEKFYYKFQNKFIFGPVIDKINSDLIKKCEKIKPDLVFIYRGTHIKKSTIKELKSFGCKVFGYNNDDPFSDKYNFSDFRLWTLYKDSVDEYDWIFAYRWKNIDDYKSVGYDNVSLLRSYYLSDKNFYIETQKIYDVIFIGHWEDDGRDATIKYLLDNGVNVKLFGMEWEQSKYIKYFNKKIGNITQVRGLEYNKTINQARIALVFLSKLNNDTYTRRCFEIPATKIMMMAEYTDDLNSMFTGGKDAEYFKSKEELLQKIKLYLEDKEKLKIIGESGYKRLLADGHEVKNRCQEIIEIYSAK